MAVRNCRIVFVQYRYNLGRTLNTNFENIVEYH